METSEHILMWEEPSIKCWLHLCVHMGSELLTAVPSVTCDHNRSHCSGFYVDSNPLKVWSWLLRSYHSKSVCNKKLCFFSCPFIWLLFLSVQFWPQSANNVFCCLGVNMCFHGIKKIKYFVITGKNYRLFQKFCMLKIYGSCWGGFECA